MIIGDVMRLRNVKGAKEKIENSKYVILDYENYKGKFREIFGNNNLLYVEIGTGKGKFIRELALKNPNINFIGIEKFDSVLVRALEKVEDEDIPNLKFIRMDATEIEKAFSHEIDKIFLNFSDPWPKARHENRRLTSTSFLKKYDNIFKDKKEIEMKTDNRHLFEFSVISLTNYGYKLEYLCLDLYSEDTSLNVSTEYEDKFHNKGFPIYKVIVTKE